MAIFESGTKIQINCFDVRLRGKIRLNTNSLSSESERYQEFADLIGIDLDTLEKLARMNMEPTPEILMCLGLSPNIVEEREPEIRRVIKKTHYYVSKDDEDINV